MRLALGFLAIARLVAQDPDDRLVRARDQILARLSNQSKHVCVETIERSYFTHRLPPLAPPSCEQILADRKKGRSRLTLDATDRLRVEVAMKQGHEIYSWTGPGTFSRSVDEILHPGPIGTGEFGDFLLDIFSNPAAHFRVLNDVEFGFRIPIEGSRYLVQTRSSWHSAGYEGAIRIDPDSLEIQRLTLATGELPPETLMCEASTTLDYPPAAGDLLLPRESRSRDILRDTSEAERLTTFSDCHEAPENLPSHPRQTAIPIPSGIHITLELTTPIDTANAAAGDVITARILDPIRNPKSSQPLVPEGALATGRIIRLEHHLTLLPYFLISIAFDTVEVNSVASPFHANWEAKPGPRGETADPSHSMFIFPTRDAHYVVPTGFTSQWRTN
jgi:hypothetical protein